MARMKSKRISRVEENFRSFFRMLKKEVRFPGGSKKPKVSEISWPQSVVKNVESGAKIDRLVEIRNPSQRLVRPQSNIDSANRISQSVENKRQSYATSGENRGDKEGAVIVSADTNANVVVVSETPLEEVGEERRKPGHVPRNSEHGTYSSINTASVGDYLSEPRSSWHHSVRRTSVAVTKVRPMKPELRQVRRSVPPSISSGDEQTLQNLQNNAAANSIPVERPDIPTTTTASNSLGPDDSPSQRRQFVFPSAIAVKRDAWRYSVDAAAICDMKRDESRSRVYGEGPVDLRETKEITDPEILEKIAKLRQKQGFKNDVEIERKRSVLRGFGAFPLDPETHRKVEELRRTSQFTQVNEESEDDLESDTDETVGDSSDITVTASSNGDDDEGLTLPSQQKQQVNTEKPAISERAPTPLPRSFVPYRTPRHQPSTISSNIQTPKIYYGRDYEPMDRVQVHAYPRETKEQYTNRGRQKILNRWSDERLQQRRRESKGLEIVTGDGKIWRSADIVLGNARYAEGPPIIRKTPSRASKVPAVPQHTNGILRHDEERLRQRESRTVKIQSPPTASRNSQADSSFSDLISASANPRGIQGLIQQFPPPPSHAIIPYRRRSLNTHALVGNNLNGESTTVRSALHQQPGPWDKSDLFQPPRSGPLSTKEATDLLHKFIRRNLYPVHTARRQQRLLESQSYFSSRPSDNEHFNSLEDMVGYIAAAYQAVDREGTHELTTLHRANILRFLVTKELIPYPAVRKELYPYLQLVKIAWPTADYLGLRPLGVVRFVHENAEILVFLSTEDDVLYLWSSEWDERLFGGRKLVRAEKTIDDCEVGVIQGLHTLEFERGGWLKINAYSDQEGNGVEVDIMENDNLYGCAKNGSIQV